MKVRVVDDCFDTHQNEIFHKENLNGNKYSNQQKLQEEILNICENKLIEVIPPYHVGYYGS